MSVDVVCVVVCEKTLIDPDTGLVSAIGLVDGVLMATPGMYMPGEVFTTLLFSEKAEGRDFEFGIDYEVLGSSDTVHSFPTQREKAVVGKVILRSKGLFVPTEPGQYVLRPRARLEGGDWKYGPSWLVTFSDEGVDQVEVV